MIWMSGQSATGQTPVAAPSHDELGPNLILFFSFYLTLIMLLALWSRALARRAASGNFYRGLRRFNQVMFVARFMVPVWFFVGVRYLSWSAVGAMLSPPLARSVVGLAMGTFPPIATWMALWWAQYPAERAMREQNLLVDLDNDLPLYRPPAFLAYFTSNFRNQVLFTLLPVLIWKTLFDCISWTANVATGRPGFAELAPFAESVALFSSTAIVFLFAPAVLRWVLSTSPMPDSPLHRRLDGLCRRAGVRYRRILVWNTHHNIGNAAVMGVLPFLRYVLLTDVLLERMSDEEIEAVFAHELGHIVHRHMTWYAVLFIVLILSIISLAALVGQWPIFAPYFNPTQFAMGGFLVMFPLFYGALSRRCERQADVYAARTLEMLKAEEPLTSQGLFDARQLATVGAGPLVTPKAARDAHVGEYGAWLFASALRRVATINNIPIAPRTRSSAGVWNRFLHWADGMVDMCNNWLHGSIASRMQYLQDLSADPRRTGHFDRTMFWLYCGLLLALVSSVVLMSIQAM